MPRRKIYIVKSGSLHKTLNEFWLTPSYHSSKKDAIRSKDDTLRINRAKDIDELDFNPEHYPEKLFQCDYIGEEGKYKGRVVIEWAYLNTY